MVFIGENPILGKLHILISMVQGKAPNCSAGEISFQELGFMAAITVVNEVKIIFATGGGSLPCSCNPSSIPQMPERTMKSLAESFGWQVSIIF